MSQTESWGTEIKVKSLCAQVETSGTISFQSTWDDLARCTFKMRQPWDSDMAVSI